MTQELIITELEEAIDALQETIASMEMDEALLKLEIVSRGDTIERLEKQNELLKHQLLRRLAEDGKPKIAALLKASERGDNG